MNGIFSDAAYIIKNSIYQVIPKTGVKEAIGKMNLTGGNIYCISVGKAAYSMAKAAYDTLGDKIFTGAIVTKYGHMKEDIPHFIAFEAGHPMPDENSFTATQHVLDLTDSLSEKDHVLFLLSGGASALFESPTIPEKELQIITEELLKKGADITEINTIRKRLSKVKGGRFALHCQPAKVHTIVLSDVLGDALDVIGSGPTYPDLSTNETARAIMEKYELTVSEEAKNAIVTETPKKLQHADATIVGSVSRLVRSAKSLLESLGYRTFVLTETLSIEARDAGALLGNIAKLNQQTEESLAFIMGGETVVHVTGDGLGGRNQEIALAAAEKIAGCKDTVVFSIGSDGTDGPTDAAGGIVSGETRDKLREKGIHIQEVLKKSDSYHALKAVHSLVITGPTGTNVNDISVVMIKR